MTIFKAFAKICFQNRGPFILYSIIFISMSILVANANKTNTVDAFESSVVKIAIFDHDESSLSKAITSFLGEHHEIIDIDEDIDEIRDRIYTRSVEYVLSIEEGFEKSILADTAADTGNLSTSNSDFLSVYTLPGSVSAQFVDMSINTFITTYNAYTLAGMTNAEAYAKTLETIKVETDVRLSNEVATSVPDIHYFYLYLPYILVAIIASVISPILIQFNELEIKRRMLISNYSATKINACLISSSAILATVLFVFYIIVSMILYGGELFNTDGFYRILNGFIYSLVALSLSFMIASISSNKNFISMFTNVFSLGCAFLCGIFVPRELLSDFVSSLGRFLPAYWYVNVENALIQTGAKNAQTFLAGYGIQLLFCIAFMSVGIIIYKKKNS